MGEVLATIDNGEEFFETAYARVGLLGNPSDMYNGEVISFALQNFSATVTLQTGAPGIRFIPHPELDSFSYQSLADLSDHVDSCGYYGGVRLLQAICKRFFMWCQKKSIDLDHVGKPGYTLSYDTSIPRQAGLSGSSAIVLAALKCLMRLYEVEVPLLEQPTLVLSAEQDLGINAGLQDRVAQVFCGLVHMDFSDPVLMSEEGRHGGTYTSLDPSLLPPLYIMHVAHDNSSESGRVHADVRQRWLSGDETAREGMTMIAACAREGRAALERRDVGTLGQLMSRNFQLRHSLYGDDALGVRNIQMVQLAEEHGCAAKFCGSGGSVVVLCPRGKSQVQALSEAATMHGFVLLKAEVASPYSALSCSQER